MKANRINGHALCEAIAAKIENGNIHAAAHLRCSNEKPAAESSQTWHTLRNKHPSGPYHVTPVTVNEPQVLTCIMTLAAGSTGGHQYVLQGSRTNQISRHKTHQRFPT
jgi:hypothetical protein